MTPTLLAVVLFLAFTVGAWLLVGATGNGMVVFKRHTAEQMQKQLTGLFLFNDADKLSTLYLALLVCMPIALFIADVGFLLIAICVVALLVSPRVVLGVLKAKRAKAINHALPDALSQLASSMRAGATFTVALQSLVEEDGGPLGEELSLLLREHRIGARMDDALDNLAERVRSEEMDLVVSAVLIAQDVGGNLAEILQSLSTTIRRKLTMEGKVAALTSQGVMQGIVVSALPFTLLAALCVIEPEATRPIFQCLLGWIVLGVMLVMQITGGIMIRKIVTIEI